MKTVILFTRNGLGEGPEGLQQALVVKYLSLLAQEEQKPSQILFYTEGVKLVCEAHRCWGGCVILKRLGWS